MAAEQISNLDEPLFALGPVRYVFRSLLGSGAFATVYLADDMQTGRPVVIKRLREVSGEDSEASIARFRAEVAATRQLQHNNIVRILDDGVAGGNRPFLVTEYTPGRSLAAVLKESGPLTRGNAIEVAVAIASALAYVHGKGFVHRDLKPSNVLIPGWPEAPRYRNSKLLDFGVAGRLEKSGRTQAGMIYGTLRYMSPEQIKGEEQSAATDVYGFGLLLYEMLAGSAPLKREQDLTTLLIAIRDGISAEDLKRIEPDVADLIGRCVRTNPAERPAMSAVLAELEASPYRSPGEAPAGDVTGSFEMQAPVAAAPSMPAPTSSASSVPSSSSVLPPAPPAPSAAQRLTGSTLVFAKQEAGAVSAPMSVPGARAGSRTNRWVAWIVLAFAVAAISVAAIFYFRPLQSSAGPPQNITKGEKPSTVPGEVKPVPNAPNAPGGESSDKAARVVRFAAGILLMAASLVIGLWLRKWLGSRSEAKSQAYELVFGARERTDLSATIALQLQDLVANVRKLDQRILAGTVALMLEEYGRATDTKDRQAALMNVVALSEKLAVRLSPWYERYKEIIASAVAVMGGVSGLMTAINSVLSHKH